MAHALPAKARTFVPFCPDSFILSFCPEEAINAIVNNILYLSLLCSNPHSDSTTLSFSLSLKIPRTRVYSNPTSGRAVSQAADLSSESSFCVSSICFLLFWRGEISDRLPRVLNFVFCGNDFARIFLIYFGSQIGSSHSWK